MGLLTDCDRLALALLCEALAEWIEAGDTIAHPAVAQQADAARRVQSLLGEFGLTPSARAKVQGLPDLPGDDPAAGFFA